MKPRRGKLLPGEIFGRLTVLGEGTRASDGAPRCDCRCECGKEVTIRNNSLIQGATRSCGCLIKDVNTRHGLARTYIYHAYRNIKKRCLDKNNKSYARYGARGISMWEPWIADPNKFKEDVFEAIGPRPSSQHSLDRIDNEGDYAPGNLRWATASQQQLNNRATRFITFNGRSLPVTTWAKELGINRNTLYRRLNKDHWSVEKALTEPVKQPPQPK